MCKGFYKFLILLGALLWICKADAQSVNPDVPGYRLFSSSEPGDSTHFKPIFSLVLPPDQSVKNLTFFCKQEWKLEKTIKIPFRFRMGSLEQCNFLEGKR